MRRAIMLAATGALCALTASCDTSPKAPVDRGVCWHVAANRDGSPKFNKLQENVPNIETCAAALEAMRAKFLGLGGNQRNIIGAYQGSYLFVQDEGILRGESLKSPRYVLLVRTGDGRLAIPGVMPRQ